MAKYFWTGSDVLFATRLLGGKKFPTKKSKYFYFAACTLIAKIMDFFVYEHCVVSEHLKHELKPLKLKKRIHVMIDPPADMTGVKLKPHKGFNILFRRGYGSNQKFYDWVYGYDIYQAVKKVITDVNWIEVGEWNWTDMKEIYPIVDFYLRPNRHEGHSRMIDECKMLGIPYFHTTEELELIESGNSVVDAAIRAINEARNKR